MAITITQSPESFASLHSDLWHVVTSNNTTQSNFKFVFDIYIASSLVARLKVFPDPTEDCGIVNVSNIVRNYWASYFKPPTTQTAFSYEGNDIYVDYEIKFGEEYNGTTYLNLTTGTYKAYNFAQPQFRDWSTSYLATFVNKWLTGRDRTNLKVGLTDRLFVPYLVGTPPQTIALKLSVDGAAQITGGGVACDSIIMLDLSPVALNTYFGTNPITASTKRYTVQIGSGDILTITLDCSKYTPEVLHFLNSLGGYDSMRFSLVNKREVTAERRSYTRTNWEVGSDVINRYNTFKVLYPGQETFSVEQTIVHRLTSDWLTQTDHAWLKDLIMSPEVYLEKSGYFYPVSIGTNNWSERIRNVDKTFNLTLDVNFGDKLNSQYR
jgi:hypothetical protein